MILLSTLVQLLDWWQRLSNLWNAHWVEIMSSWMSCALMPLNFTSDYVWSRWYFGLSTTAAPLCSTYSICVSSISVSLHVSWRRTCHWWKRISNQIAFLWLCCFLKCHQWFPNRNGQVHIPELWVHDEPCTASVQLPGLRILSLVFFWRACMGQGSRKAVLTCFPSN